MCSTDVAFTSHVIGISDILKKGSRAVEYPKTRSVHSYNVMKTLFQFGVDDMDKIL